MRKARRKQSRDLGTKINNAIRAREVRVVIPGEGDLGVMTRDAAIALAEERGLDLILISDKATPPVTRIADYGKFQYEHKKKQRDIHAKARAAQVDVKEIQIKPGTSDHDMEMKVNPAMTWLNEGHRVKMELFLRGRSKYMKQEFLKERLMHFLSFVTVPYTIVQDIKKVPKGLALIIEKDRKAVKEEQKQQKEKTKKDTTNKTSDTASSQESISDEKSAEKDTKTEETKDAS